MQVKKGLIYAAKTAILISGLFCAVVPMALGESTFSSQAAQSSQSQSSQSQSQKQTQSISAVAVSSSSASVSQVSKSKIEVKIESDEDKDDKHDNNHRHSAYHKEKKIVVKKRLPVTGSDTTVLFMIAVLSLATVLIGTVRYFVKTK
jgi:hypothetical protein